MLEGFDFLSLFFSFPYLRLQIFGLCSGLLRSQVGLGLSDNEKRLKVVRIAFVLLAPIGSSGY